MNKKLEDIIFELWIKTKELAESQKETDRQMKETDKQMKETGEQMKETDKRLNKVISDNKRFWWFMDNDWKVVEEYFFSWLNKTNKLHWENYDHFSREANYYLKKWKEREFDIIWFNWNKITALEIKKIVHKNDVEKLVEKQLPFLKEYMSKNTEYRTHKIYWWIAWFKINPDAEKYAREKWLIILTKHWNQIEELTKDCEIKALA